MNILRAAIILFSGLTATALCAGAVGGCGGNGPSQAATTLAGTYDCVEGCSGDCVFSDTMGIEIGRVFPDEDRTTLNIDCTIETDLSVFNGSEGNGGAKDSGEFSFVVENDDGDIECAGTSIDAETLSLNCVAIEVVGEDAFEKTCQEVTYQKK